MSSKSSIIFSISKSFTKTSATECRTTHILAELCKFIDIKMERYFIRMCFLLYNIHSKLQAISIVSFCFWLLVSKPVFIKRKKKEIKLLTVLFRRVYNKI